MTSVQLDSNSCGVWLIAAMAACAHSLPKPSVRNDAFDIAFSLFGRKKEFRDENVESEVPSFENWESKDCINIYTSAKFLIDVLKNNPANSPFCTEVLLKGIRSNYFYITGTTKCPMPRITADDNEAYVKTRNTNKLYCEVGENAHTVHIDDNQSLYDTRSSNTYVRSYLSINDVIMLKRSYCVSKSLLLLRTIVSFASPVDGPNIPYVAVFYQTHSNFSESATIQSYGNVKRTSATPKPYYRTSNDVLAKAKKLLKTGMQAKAIYDKINDESGGVYASSSQGQGLRDTSKVYRQKEIESVKKEPHDDLLNVIVCKVKATN